MSSTPLTPGSVDGGKSPASSPPSSPPSAHEADMEYHESKPATKAEAKTGSLTDLENYLGLSQNFSSQLMDQLKSALDARKSQTLAQPKLVTGGTLKEYQLEGLTWLTCLYTVGLNGLLADEMGLGKTIQVIAFVAWLHQNNIHGHILILGPLSTVRNWVNEFQKWTPKIPVVMYRGTPAERAKLRAEQFQKDAETGAFPVICTSYETCMRDKKFLSRSSKIRWKFLIVDEGHRLKNFNCKLVKELREYDNESRLILTGTPLQNNLAELWSLLNFLLPEAFGDLEQFEKIFNISDTKTQTKAKNAEKPAFSAEYRAQTIASLHSILKPFLLRRIKTDVELTLPKKREYLLYAPLTAQQKELYRKIKDHEIREHLEEKAIERMGGGQVHNLSVQNFKRKADSGTTTPNKSVKSSRSSTPASTRATRGRNKKYAEVSDDEYFEALENEASDSSLESDHELSMSEIRAKARKEVGHKALQNPVMQLRLLCNSPHHFSRPWGDTEDPDNSLITASGKMILLDRLVTALLARGHKILIFSQWQVQLDFLHDWAEVLHGWPVCRIDGSVTATDREQAIETFNTDEDIRICLVTTRAGGQGINLTAADTVILFDSDWNPQQDLQAQDRAHRIGQTRPVIVYRLATKGTVEQILLEKADGKRRLEKLVIQKDKFRSIVGKTRKQDKKKEGEDVEQLQKILDEDEDFAYEPEEGEEGVLSERDLQRLTDRSDEAYARELEGKGEASDRFKAFERRGDDGGLLGDMGK